MVNAIVTVATIIDISFIANLYVYYVLLEALPPVCMKYAAQGKSWLKVRVD